MAYSLRIKRIYDASSETDGYRILADRLWPRGIRKDQARLDAWWKDIAPSSDLRKRFHADHDYAAFRMDYFKELDENPQSDTFLSVMKKQISKSNVTLLTAVKDPEHSNIAVLKEYILKNADVS